MLSEFTSYPVKAKRRHHALCFSPDRSCCGALSRRRPDDQLTSRPRCHFLPVYKGYMARADRHSARHVAIYPKGDHG